MTTTDPRGDFPHYTPVDAGPGYARFLAAMRRLQDLAVSTDPDPAGWDAAADAAEALVDRLAPAQVGEGVGPANRVPTLPGAGSLLMPPWLPQQYDADGVRVSVTFTRFYLGGGAAVHGGVLPLLFDAMCGMVVHASAGPTSRTAYLNVDYRQVTPLDVPLTGTAQIVRREGRKSFVELELRDPDAVLLAEGHALMVALRPGQP